ncbi:uncharacterized protein C7orf50 homolog isoform X2 [Seriola lalandi dorsalis]|uniref:WKF domain-containing protein n=2 Tax=Seriola lalandi dorsalis TaxID=1841481 RepID=A0A3B4XKW9_SERLL|nr:uncharacterized protein C7orf50 homolog isoform X2 [Seriola lalandi dorsalis]XP_023266996.1 uncharacterized protein C7orf50 homolog isoform X2 [Seriola lalandi dorsalis]XP_056222207.1 uncharacterized protein C7orf50 homolog [Seriola aureovittata]XP_056222208.1 uncharacterized protein C7orf50 homolog [Seriola aureovittata]
MAKDKSLKSGSSLPKRKKLGSNASEVHPEEMMDAEVKKKRKKMEVEDAPVQIPQDTITADDKKQKKDKKHKKKQVTEPTKISDPPSRPEGTHEPEGEEDLSPEERRVLERKMKKILKKEEKKRLKAEGETLPKTEASGPTAPQQALDYLTCWAERRTEWKFQKTRQTWLLQHMFDSEKIPDEKFSVLLEYLEGLRGGARDTTVQKALALVEESGQAPEDVAVQQRAHRAREVIQLLS